MWPSCLTPALTSHTTKTVTENKSSGPKVSLSPSLSLPPGRGDAEATLLTSKFRVVVYSSGEVLYVPPLDLHYSCVADLAYWPHDTHECTLTIGSWVHDANSIDLKLNDGVKVEVCVCVCAARGNSIGVERAAQKQVFILVIKGKRCDEVEGLLRCDMLWGTEWKGFVHICGWRWCYGARYEDVLAGELTYVMQGEERDDDKWRKEDGGNVSRNVYLEMGVRT